MSVWASALRLLLRCQLPVGSPTFLLNETLKEMSVQESGQARSPLRASRTFAVWDDFDRNPRQLKASPEEDEKN